MLSRLQAYQRWALAAYALVALLTVLVQLGWLAGLDQRAFSFKQQIANPWLDGLGRVAGIAVSAEFSVAYGLLAAALLWRLGVGWWSLAPLAFVLIVPVEILLKVTISQPQVPSEFHHGNPYPLMHVLLPGAFPSGHASRTAFFGVFAAVLLAWRSGGTRLLALLVFCLSLLVAYTRTYVGDHWLSDVLAGYLGGAATALLVAVPLAARLAQRRNGLKSVVRS